MSKGRRYGDEPKLNYKKVFAVAIAFVVIIMAIIMLKNILTKAKNTKPLDVVDYYSLYQDEKWGIVGSNGEIVIEPMYQEMLIVVDKSKDVFLCTYDINEEDGTYKTIAINKNNEEIFTNYDKVESLENYDNSGNVWYEENILKVQKDGKWGIIDLNGNQIKETIYDDIYTLKGVKNSIIVKKDEMLGLVNDKGVDICKPEFKEITGLGGENKNLYLTLDEENQYGIVNFSGNTLLENKYEKIENLYSEKYFVVTIDGKKKVIDQKGNTILENLDGEIKQIANDGIVFIKDGKYGLLSFDGNILIEPTTYTNLKEINTGIFLVTKDGKCGVIDKEQNEKIAFLYTNIYYDNKARIYVADNEEYKSTILDTNFEVKVIGILSEINTEDGYLKIKLDDEYKYYNFKFEEKNKQDIYTDNKIFVNKQDGKYGFIDEKGKIVVDYIYDDATELNQYGYAAVKKDNLWGAIDKERKCCNRANI